MEKPINVRLGSPPVKVHAHLYIYDTLLDLADDAARQLGLSRSAFICMAVAKELKQLGHVD